MKAKEQNRSNQGAKKLTEGLINGNNLQIFICQNLLKLFQKQYVV